MAERKSICSSNLCIKSCALNGLSEEFIAGANRFRALANQCPNRMYRNNNKVSTTQIPDIPAENEPLHYKTYGLKTWIIKQVCHDFGARGDKIDYYAGFINGDSTKAKHLFLRAIDIRDRFPHKIDLVDKIELTIRFNKQFGPGGIAKREISPSPEEFDTFLNNYLDTIKRWNPQEYEETAGEELLVLTLTENQIMEHPLFAPGTKYSDYFSGK